MARIGTSIDANGGAMDKRRHNKNGLLLANTLKNHPSLLFNRDISEISKPLFQQFDYNIVNFIRVYKDRKVIYLCDNYDWLKNYLSKHFPSIGVFEQIGQTIQKDFVLWDILSEKDPIVIDSHTMFNIHYGITIVRKTAHWHDFFNFGTPHHDPSAIGQILGQIEALQGFVNNFYDKAKHLILKLESHAIQLDKLVPAGKENESSKNGRLYLGPKYNYSYLTQKELQCLEYLITGKTAAEIGVITHSSSRTVEKHIEHIKNKLRCKTLFEMGYVAYKLGIKAVK